MYDLFPHQQAIIDELRDGFMSGHKRIMLAAATGLGKTVIASHIALKAKRYDKRVLFVVHLKALVQQAVDHFSGLGLHVGVLQGDNTAFTRDDDVIIASIHTIRSRGAPDWCELVIIDEAHVLYQAHIDLMKSWNALPFIGLSATPLRPDLGKYFDGLVRGPSIDWLTEEGFLVPARAYCPAADQLRIIREGVATRKGIGGTDFNESQLGDVMNNKALIADIVTTWQRHGEGRQTLVFAVNKAHSRAIVDDFNSEGIPAAHIEDRTPDFERKELVDAFTTGDIRVLCSVGVLAIGFDSPIASCVILARPTKSLALHLQQVGRGIRRCEGKSDCILLDHSGNIIEHGLPVHFEVPDLETGDREQSSASSQKAAKNLSICKACGYILEPEWHSCPSCGTDRPQRKNYVETVDGDLHEYGSEPKDVVDSYEKRLSWYLGFVHFGMSRGYKNPRGWAYHQYLAKFGNKPPWDWKDWSSEPPSLEQRNWIRSRQIAWAKAKKRKVEKTFAY